MIKKKSDPVSSSRDYITLSFTTLLADLEDNDCVALALQALESVVDQDSLAPTVEWLGKLFTRDELLTALGYEIDVDDALGVINRLENLERCDVVDEIMDKMTSTEILTLADRKCTAEEIALFYAKARYNQAK